MITRLFSCIKAYQHATIQIPRTSTKRAWILVFSFSLLLTFKTTYYLHHKTVLLQLSLRSFFLSNNKGSINSATVDDDGFNHNVSHFVTFHESIKDGRRLGNELFSLAAILFVAEIINGNPVIENSLHLRIDDIFQLNLQRVSNLCPCYTIGEKKHLSYDVNTEKLTVSDPQIGNKTVLVKGYRQSWKYTLAIERQLRRHLVFRVEIHRFAESFLQQNIPRGWKRVGFTRVGVHIRRTDNLKSRALEYGYTVPNETYFIKAMEYFTDRYSRVQFLVASDDFTWTRQHIVSKCSSLKRINITFSCNNTAGQDLAILSMCDHVIMSTGTFGWWAAWLAKGTTIYYRDWPLVGSPLAGEFNQRDFFPPSWIPMTGY